MLTRKSSTPIKIERVTVQTSTDHVTRPFFLPPQIKKREKAVWQRETRWGTMNYYDYCLPSFVTQMVTSQLAINAQLCTHVAI